MKHLAKTSSHENPHNKSFYPPYLHEFHGKQARILDLLLTYSVAAFATILTLHLASHSFTETYKFVILGILAFDLSGGVVSNFTEGTNSYYREKPKARSVFIALHIIQPLLIVWLFADSAFVIMALSIYTLISLIIVNNIKQYVNQRVLAGFFTTLGITTSFLFNDISEVVHLLLILFLVKLTLAFAVRWE